MAELTGFGKGFQTLRHTEFCLLVLLAVPLALLRLRGLFRLALHLLRLPDRWLLKVFPFLRRYAWITVIEVEK